MTLIMLEHHWEFRDRFLPRRSPRRWVAYARIRWARFCWRWRVRDRFPVTILDSHGNATVLTYCSDVADAVAYAQDWCERWRHTPPHDNGTRPVMRRMWNQWMSYRIDHVRKIWVEDLRYHRAVWAKIPHRHGDTVRGRDARLVVNRMANIAAARRTLEKEVEHTLPPPSIDD